MSQQGSENVDVYQFHRDPWVSNCMGNMINQPVFAEKVLEKKSFSGFFGFPNFTFLRKSHFLEPVWLLCCIFCTLCTYLRHF